MLPASRKSFAYLIASASVTVDLPLKTSGRSSGVTVAALYTPLKSGWPAATRGFAGDWPVKWMESSALSATVAAVTRTMRSDVMADPRGTAGDRPPKSRGSNHETPAAPSLLLEVAVGGRLGARAVADADFGLSWEWRLWRPPARFHREYDRRRADAARRIRLGRPVLTR